MCMKIVNTGEVLGTSVNSQIKLVLLILSSPTSSPPLPPLQ